MPSLETYSHTMLDCNVGRLYGHHKTEGVASEEGSRPRLPVRWEERVLVSFTPYNWSGDQHTQYFTYNVPGAWCQHLRKQTNQNLEILLVLLTYLSLRGNWTGLIINYTVIKLQRWGEDFNKNHTEQWWRAIEECILIGQERKKSSETLIQNMHISYILYISDGMLSVLTKYCMLVLLKYKNEAHFICSS